MATPTSTNNAPGDYFLINRRCDACSRRTLYLRIAADGSRSYTCYSCN